MFSIRDLPIRHKLTLISVLTSLVALVLACTGMVTFEQLAFRREIVRDLSITAHMLGFNSSAALSFGDNRTAERTLQGLSAQPHIVKAALYSLEGEVFATYQRAPEAGVAWPSALAMDREQFGPGVVDVLERIDYDGEKIGSIYLQSDLDEIRARWQRYSFIVAAVVLVAGLVAWLVSSRLQRMISKPVSQLASIARRVATEGDYSVRAVKRSNDELGQLMDGFNHMLTQVQARDAELERRVQERTSQLLAEATERNRVTDALRVSEGFLHSLLEHLPVNIYRRDKEGRLIFANRQFCEDLGQPLSALLGKTDFELSPPEVAEKYWQDTLLVMSTRQPVERVESHPRPNGRDAWIQTIKVAVIDNDDQVVGSQGMFWDVTERKQAEQEVERLHRQLVMASRHAGMAEVATGVLHNVGNVLNSVNVSANLIADTLRKSKVGNVARVAALLQENAGNMTRFLSEDPRGQQVQGYLVQLSDHLTSEQRSVVNELDELRKNMEHIKEIVSMQQSYAKVSGVLETVKVSDLVEDAIRMNAGALVRHNVTLVRDFRDLPEVTTDKHKVLQILVNLIRNAKYACDESGRADKVLTVRLVRQDQSIQIAVIDNGVGIPAENLTRIFNHGFTTREDGHGFGLHSGALAAKEMGGTLTVTSAGPGQGASFLLQLPLPRI